MPRGFESVVEVLRRTDLVWYSGDDGLNLPFLSIGGAGFVSVTGHFVAQRLGELATTFWSGMSPRLLRSMKHYSLSQLGSEPRVRS